MLRLAIVLQIYRVKGEDGGLTLLDAGGGSGPWILGDLAECFCST